MSAQTGAEFQGLLPAYVLPGSGAIVLCNGKPPAVWMERVAGEFAPERSLYVWQEGETYHVSVVDGRQRPPASREDLEWIARSLCCEGRVDEDAEVQIRGDGETAILIARRGDSIAAGARETVRDTPSHEASIRQRNAAVVTDLVKSLRSKTGVIPFVGAGGSKPFGYPLWGAFFEECAAAAKHEELLQKVREDVKKLKFEEAAQRLVDHDKNAFYERVRDAFSKPPDLAKAGDSPLTRLPLLTTGPVITTNFDTVIEHLYARDGRAFGVHDRVLGRNDPLSVVTALQQDQSTLIKLHGDASQSDSLTFTAVEYEQSYGTSQRLGPVAQIATVLYTNRPLLFLGCSLETDRTLQSLKEVHKANPYVSHFAVLAASYRSNKFQARLKELDDAGIKPLWFPSGAFEEIPQLLDDVVHRAATDELRPPAPEARKTVMTASMSPSMIDKGAKAATASAHTQDAVDALLSGRLAFFLGAAVYPNRMHGLQFYQELCRRADVPWPSQGWGRADAAQYVADAVGRARLSSIVESIVTGHYTRPSEIHSLLASLPQMLRKSPAASEPLMLITTNYDSVLETAFDSAGEPYHLFVYNGYGPYSGCFLHRLPDDSEYVIRKPSAVRRLSPAAAVIVKLNGGVDPRGRWQSTFAVASRDFVVLAARIPEVIPRVIWDALRLRSLLFWGHGLREPDVREFTRALKLERTWAVQLGVTETDVQYAAAAGVELIDEDLVAYVGQFSLSLKNRLTSLSAAQG